MDCPALPDLESNSQWDDPMALDPGFSPFQEQAFSDCTENMEDVSDEENDSPRTKSEADDGGFNTNDEPAFPPLGLDMAQYFEQPETLYKEQSPGTFLVGASVSNVPDILLANTTGVPSVSPPTLNRLVLFIAGAARIAEQTAFIHNILVSHEVSRFNQAIDTHARFAEVVHVPADQTRCLFEEQVSIRVDNLRKVWIEPRVGAFSQADREHIEKLPRFEQRILATMNIGLIRQESIELLLLDADADMTLMQDFYGSCLLEARKWQLQLLRDWVAELDGKTIKAGDCIAESFIKARVTG